MISSDHYMTRICLYIVVFHRYIKCKDNYMFAKHNYMIAKLIYIVVANQLPLYRYISSGCESDKRLREFVSKHIAMKANKIMIK